MDKREIHEYTKTHFMWFGSSDLVQALIHKKMVIRILMIHLTDCSRYADGIHTAIWLTDSSSEQYSVSFEGQIKEQRALLNFTE
jgi:hypothetical protein